MLIKLFQRRILIVGMVVLVFLSLSFFLYWKTFNSAVIVEQLNTKQRGTDETPVSMISAPDSEKSTRALSTKPE